MQPETKYARSGDVNIAYQVVGRGPIDLVFVMGWVSHLDYYWEEPSFARFLSRLASFSRLILFDKRGTGLSDRVPDSQLPTLEQRMDDVRAVMDAVGSPRAALLGISEGGPMCALFAATYPERTLALIMYGSYARRAWSPDYPWGATQEQWEASVREVRERWGEPVWLDIRAPGLASDQRFRQWWAMYLTRSASPGAVLALTRMNYQIDIRHVLPTIRVPTLVVHRTGDLALSIEGSRYMAQRIPGARLRKLGIEIRAGLHTGEVEVMGPTVGGIAVHIGARVAALAGAGEVLASSTVRDLVAGSGILFEERGRHALKGIPGEWQVCAVECGGPPRLGS